MQSLELRQPFFHLRIGGIHFVRLRHVGVSRIPFVQAEESACAQDATRGRILRGDCFHPVSQVVFPTLLRRAQFCETIVLTRGIGSRRLCREICKPMPFRALVLLALEAQGAAIIFDRRCSAAASCFLPRTERLLQAIEVFDFQLRLRECVPSIEIVWSDGDNPPAQFANRWLIIRILGCLQLQAQLPKLLRFCCD